MNNKISLLNAMKARAEEYRVLAVKAKQNLDTQSADVYFARADSMKEAQRLVEGFIKDETNETSV
jgi:uncharacterized membrane protein